MCYDVVIAVRIFFKTPLRDPRISGLPPLRRGSFGTTRQRIFLAVCVFPLQGALAPGYEPGDSRNPTPMSTLPCCPRLSCPHCTTYFLPNHGKKAANLKKPLKIRPKGAGSSEVFRKISQFPYFNPIFFCFFSLSITSPRNSSEPITSTRGPKERMRITISGASSWT